MVFVPVNACDESNAALNLCTRGKGMKGMIIHRHCVFNLACI